MELGHVAMLDGFVAAAMVAMRQLAHMLEEDLHLTHRYHHFHGSRYQQPCFDGDALVVL